MSSNINLHLCGFDDRFQSCPDSSVAQNSQLPAQGKRRKSDVRKSDDARNELRRSSVRALAEICEIRFSLQISGGNISAN